MAKQLARIRNEARVGHLLLGYITPRVSLASANLLEGGHGMARVPITVMGFHCERCSHEWIPRRPDSDPRVCPSCKSPYWDTPRKSGSATTYNEFRLRIKKVLERNTEGLSWTEVRTASRLPQVLPNNAWVRRLEDDIGLRRTRERGAMIWRLNPQT